MEKLYRNFLTSPSLVLLSLVLGLNLPTSVKAEPTCSTRQVGEHCTIIFSVDAGSCSKDTGCYRDTGFIENAVPSGYAVIGWTKYDDSWNDGTFNVQNASRGQNSSWNQAYQSLSQTFQETKFKLDYLSKEATQIGNLAARSEVEKKINILSSDFNRSQTKWSSMGQVNTNTDLFKLQAKSWYTCTRKTWIGCMDGFGNHGKGHIVVNLVFIGEATPLIATSTNLKQNISSLESEIAKLKSLPLTNQEGGIQLPAGITNLPMPPSQQAEFIRSCNGYLEQYYRNAGQTPDYALISTGCGCVLGELNKGVPLPTIQQVCIQRTVGGQK